MTLMKVYYSQDYVLTLKCLLNFIYDFLNKHRLDLLHKNHSNKFHICCLDFSLSLFGHICA